jgi:phosphatidylglycerophosphate synthase
MNALPDAAAAASPSRFLVLVPPPGEVSIRPETPLLGLPLVRRTALAARRAGFDEVFWGGGTPAPALPEALSGVAVAGAEDGEPDSVRFPWNRIATVESLRRLRATGGDGGAPEVSAPRDLRAAERFLLAALVKESDSPIARHVNRKVSLFVSRLLAPTGVTPNQMTVACAGIGLLGAACFLSAAPARQLAGGVLFLLHSILDGCDGEIARLKFLESRRGGVLDFWSDNVVHAAVFAAIAVGWSRQAGAAFPLGLGALAVLGSLASAGFVFASTMRGPAAAGKPLFVSVTKGPGTGVSKVADLLARRDFIYLVLILAAVGRVHWFLVLSAIGAPVFFLVLLVISYRGRQAERIP